MIGIDVSQYVPRAATALYKAGVPFTDTTLETFDCGQLLPYCVDFGIRGKLARATCPVTCGCADLMSGNTLATSIHGCQLQCAAAQYLPLQQNNVSAIGFPGLNIRSTSNSLLHTSTFDVFSAVSTAICARKYSFFSIFRDLQDVHYFSPLHSQQFSKISLPCLLIFIPNLMSQTLKFLFIFAVFRTYFDETLSE